MATRPAAAKQAATKTTANKTASRKAAPAAAKPTPPTPSKKAAPAAATPKPVTAPIITLKAVFEELGVTHDMSKKQVQALLTDLVASMTLHLRKGARIRMSGLGTLEVKTRAARVGRNPATGEPIEIKASKKVAFRAAKELKEAV